MPLPTSVGKAPKCVGVLFDGALEGVADGGVGEAVFVDDEAGAGVAFGDGAGGDGFFADGFASGFGAGFGGAAFFGAGLLLFAGVAGFTGFFAGFGFAGGLAGFAAFGGFDGVFAAAFFP